MGSYLTVWPNLMMNVFPDAVLIMWMEPTERHHHRVERRLYLAPGHTDDRRAGVIAAHRQVHQQDVDICTSVQRSHDAGLDADGVLATVEERGVFFVHEHLRAAAGWLRCRSVTARTIVTIGDLVEDLAVRLESAVHLASDTEAIIHRRRGGSAANTAVAIARLGHPARFIGQVGDDPIGGVLVDALLLAGVEPVVRRSGRTGTIVVLVDHAGRAQHADRPWGVHRSSTRPTERGSTRRPPCTCRGTRWSASRWPPPRERSSAGPAPQV